MDNEISSDCHVFAYSSKFTIATFGYSLSSSTDHENDVDGIFIGVLDTSKLKVVAYNWRKLYVDAESDLNDSSLRIDPSTFKLNKTVEAFGLKYESAASGARCVDAGWENLLTLFVRHGSALSPVFHTYRHIWMFTDGCDALAGSVPTDANLRIAVASKRTNGYRDLIITNTSENEKVVLEYNGRKYLWPTNNAPWWTSYGDSGEDWILP